MPRINAKYAAFRLIARALQVVSRRNAGITQLVEHDLAKVGVASSNLVSRSRRFVPGTVSAVLLLIASLSGPAWAQEAAPAPDPAPTATATPDEAAATSVDVSGRSQEALTRLTSIADEVTTLTVPEQRAERIALLAAELDNEFGPMEAIEGRLVPLSQSQLDDLDRNLNEDQSEVGEQSDRLQQLALALES